MSKEIRTLLNSKLDYAELLASLLTRHGETLPTKPGKESNKSKRLKKLIGPNRGLALAKTDVQFQALLEHKDPDIQALAQARLAINSWPDHQKRILNIETLADCSSGRVPIPTRYAGAHTKRCSGTEGVNFYNLPKRGHPLITKIKSLVRTQSNHKLLIFDFAQIEARYVAWLAGQQDLVAAFASGRDVYSEFATEFFQQKVRKPLPTDPPPTAKRLNKRRQFGKKVILGSGYGMGPSRFYDSCKEEGLEITAELAERLVKAYRNKYSKIVQLWYDLEGNFKFVVRFPLDNISSHRIGFHNDTATNSIVVTLPSGMRLYYPDAQFCKTNNNIKWRWSKGGGFWGGAMAENFTQADCGYILREKAVQIEKELGLRVLLDVYDSLYILTPASPADRNFKRVEEILTRPLSWCEDLPLAVEGEVAECLQ